MSSESAAGSSDETESPQALVSASHRFLNQLPRVASRSTTSELDPSSRDVTSVMRFETSSEMDFAV